MVEFNESVNGIPTRAIYSEENINNLFLPLLRQWSAMQQKLGRRLFVVLAAPPGAGKSTLCAFLQSLALQQGCTPVTVIGMDGFHRRQEYLLSHNITVDGVEMPMVRIKGAMETFDLDGLRQAMTKVAAGACCGWPVYDRTLHNPVPDAVTVSGDIVLMEGNYLLSNREGWRDLRRYADVTVRVFADEAMLRRRLIDRRVAGGTPLAESERFVDFSDMRNVRECLTNTQQADVNLQILPDDTYRLC